VKRIQLELDERTWETLQARSRQLSLSVPELLRQAIHQKYGVSLVARRQAMQALVGLWRHRTDVPDTETYVRRLRKGRRLDGNLNPKQGSQ
jgi:hypothetical protein